MAIASVQPRCQQKKKQFRKGKKKGPSFSKHFFQHDTGLNNKLEKKYKSFLGIFTFHERFENYFAVLSNNWGKKRPTYVENDEKINDEKIKGKKI